MGEHLNDESLIFNWHGLEIHQHSDVFKVGTDAILLGSWASQIISKSNFILDVGTGTGILALMMAKRFSNALVYAIDSDEKAIQLAQKNVRLSPASGRIQVIAESILNQKKDHDPLFDLIVCNPPYYFEQYPAKNGSRVHAKHREASGKEWMRSLLTRIDPRGHLCIIVPFDTAFHWIDSANQYGFYCHRRLDVYSFQEDREPVRSLLKFSCDLVQPQNEWLAIYEENKSYTNEYRLFAGI